MDVNRWLIVHILTLCHHRNLCVVSLVTLVSDRLWELSIIFIGKISYILLVKEERDSLFSVTEQHILGVYHDLDSSFCCINTSIYFELSVLVASITESNLSFTILLVGLMQMDALRLKVLVVKVKHDFTSRS